MSNLYDYLKWRGDLSFKSDPFNEIDNLILANLCYVHFEGIVSDKPKYQPLKLSEAIDCYLSRPEDKWLYRDKEDLNFIKVLKDVPRYKDIRLYYQEGIYDHESETQFAAMCFKIQRGLTYIGFRGTDGFLAGWKEDFNTSFTITASQKLALAYLEKAARINFDKLIIGGHSKGGNLAVYAAALSKSSLKKRIISIYSNDGPGFNYDLISEETLSTIKDRLTIFTPKTSIIAQIMEQIKRPKIIASSESFFMQHDPYSWQIENKHFVLEDDYDTFSKVMRSTMQKWLKDIDRKDREIIVNTAYELIKALNTQNVNELLPSLLKNFTALLKKRKDLDENDRRILSEALGDLVGALKESLFIKDES